MEERVWLIEHTSNHLVHLIYQQSLSPLVTRLVYGPFVLCTLSSHVCLSNRGTDPVANWVNTLALCFMETRYGTL